MRVRLVFLCHIRIYLPAKVHLALVVGVAVNDEPYGENVIDTLEWNLLLLHLLVDGVGGLGPDFQLVSDTCIGQFLFERTDKFLREFHPVFLSGFQLVGDEAVIHGVGEPEVYVLKFALDIVESKLVGERNVQH